MRVFVPEQKKIVITASRDYTNDFTASIWIDAYVRKMIPPGSLVIHGNARGGDRIAAESAKRHGCELVPFEPDWKQHGKKAGFLRNLEMLDTQPDSVIAFWNGKSKGCKHTIDEAMKRGIPTEVVRIP